MAFVKNTDYLPLPGVPPAIEPVSDATGHAESDAEPDMSWPAIQEILRKEDGKQNG